MKPVDSIEVANALGESVLWHGETQSLWWTDIEARRLYRYDWRRKTLQEFATPERLCSFGFVRQSTRLIAAFESGFALYDPVADITEWLARPDAERTGHRLNDGRVDRQGRFWAGGMAETETNIGKMSLYCVDAAGRAQRRESGITIANGICWSPDGTHFYFADSPRRIIWRYAFDAPTGEISDRRVFVQTPEGALPDGANVDADGFLWSAHWGAGRVVRYTPEGHVDRVLDVPACQPTCVAFGGPQLDLLFVTSARCGLDEATLERQPNAGNVFIYDIGIKGLPENAFILDAR